MKDEQRTGADEKDCGWQTKYEQNLPIECDAGSDDEHAEKKGANVEESARR